MAACRFSKNRHGRFQESNLFQELFESIIEQCIAAGLVEGEQMSVDGSFIMANASHHGGIPREQFTETAPATEVAHADMYRRLGRTAEVRAAHEQALALTQPGPDNSCKRISCDPILATTGPYRLATGAGNA